MAKKSALKGMDEVLGNLNNEINGIEGRTPQGLLIAGLDILRLSNEYVPVHEGTLRASGYAQRHPTIPLAVIVGYSAKYAVFVHENMEQKLKGQPRPDGKGVYWGPHGRPKFLESALIEKYSDTLETIRKHAEITGGKK